MARVAIDPHMFGEAWFAEIRGELLKSRNVRFSFSGLLQEHIEISRRKDVLTFYKLVGELNRRDDAHQPTAKRNEENLVVDQHWVQNKSICDDPHIFALVKSLPTKYVFTLDLRMVKCRDCLRGKIDNNYLRFSAITTATAYESNRVDILAP